MKTAGKASSTIQGILSIGSSDKPHAVILYCNYAHLIGSVRVDGAFLKKGKASPNYTRDCQSLMRYLEPRTSLSSTQPLSGFATG